ncbi:hypothetical protein [Sphingomonas alpina]|uniref:Uncharacterized protein n=1 Tax=Sphingomonas alpina TaxID=653931 RepID=A0A7H0LKJ7_9SPHN|nr:hypothetical protein [Sphingomonas alpina]QNQ10200.1 hypothetical protein H3Z74_02855 [Sphingomonas alpina]
MAEATGLNNTARPELVEGPLFFSLRVEKKNGASTGSARTGIGFHEGQI